MSLMDAIEGLYRAFAGYGLAATIVGCPHCELGEAESRLHRAPLRRLDGEDLGVFAFKAMTTFGDVDDFRHFLPRIAELLSRDPIVEACDLDVFLGKLDYGRWASWPEAERAALTTWLGALEAAYLADEARLYVDFEGVVRAARARGDVEGLVERWARTSSRDARRTLAQGVVALAKRAEKGPTTGPMDRALVAHVDALRTCFEEGLETDDDPALHRALVDLTGRPFRDIPA